MKWKKVKLGDCCKSIADGDHQAPPKVDKGIPFITISNFSFNRIDFTNTMFVPKDYYDSLDDKRKACKNDILYSVVGSYGIPVFIQDDKQFTFQRHIAILKPSPDKVVPIFLYYCMLNHDFYLRVNAIAIGSAQKTVTLGMLRNLEIEVPSIEFQNKIVEILRPYDDLIENNRRQIALLEEAASRLYKEWFVDFHFPGHEQVKIVDGVPEGWSKKQLCEIATIFSGYPFSSKTMNKEGKYKIITIKNIQDGRLDSSSVDCIDSIPDNMPDYCKLNEKDILLSMTGNVGRVCIFFGKNCLLNQRVAKITGSNLGYLYCLFRSPDMYNKICNLSNGVAQQNLSLTRIRKTQILFPAKNIREVFEKNIIPMINQILTVSKQNRLLQEARDRLLPKLMNGEIEVRP